MTYIFASTDSNERKCFEKEYGATSFTSLCFLVSVMVSRRMNTWVWT